MCNRDWDSGGLTFVLDTRRHIANDREVTNPTAWVKRRKRKQRARDWLNWFRGTVECAICGCVPRVDKRGVPKIQFHHVDEELKWRDVATATGSGLGSVKRELAKCIPVCHRCHVDIHKGSHTKPRLERIRREWHKKNEYLFQVR